jgi:hypothetical protein
MKNLRIRRNISMFGPSLLLAVEKSLCYHLELLGCRLPEGFSFDFSKMRVESETSRRVYDGWCATYSNVALLGPEGRILGIGNIDYILNKQGEPLFWWEHLSIWYDSALYDVAFYEYEFPDHIWNAMDSEQRDQFKRISQSPAEVSENIFEQDLERLINEHPMMR